MIETARLRLRPHGLGDLTARAAMTANPRVMAHLGGVQGREENWVRIQRYAGHRALLGYGMWAVEERASGRWVGEVGLARFERGLGPAFDPYPEGGWLLDEWAWGRGFAVEAMAAAIAWHARAIGPGRCVCLIACDNAPSLRLAARLGFVGFAEARYRDRPVTLLERLPKRDEAR